MAYVVKVTFRAERDFQGIFDEINAEHSLAALKWYQGFKRAIFSLEIQPNRCPRTPESLMYRHLLYGREPHIYRAIYRVLERQRQVEVLHIRPGARDRLKKSGTVRGSRTKFLKAMGRVSKNRPAGKDLH